MPASLVNPTTVASPSVDMTDPAAVSTGRVLRSRMPKPPRAVSPKLHASPAKVVKPSLSGRLSNAAGSPQRQPPSTPRTKPLATKKRAQHQKASDMAHQEQVRGISSPKEPLVSPSLATSSIDSAVTSTSLEAKLRAMSELSAFAFGLPRSLENSNGDSFRSKGSVGAASAFAFETPMPESIRLNVIVGGRHSKPGDVAASVPLAPAQAAMTEAEKEARSEASLAARRNTFKAPTQTAIAKAEKEAQAEANLLARRNAFMAKEKKWAEAAAKKDRLCQLPPKNMSYVNMRTGQLLWSCQDEPYQPSRLSPPPKPKFKNPAGVPSDRPHKPRPDKIADLVEELGLGSKCSAPEWKALTGISILHFGPGSVFSMSVAKFAPQEEAFHSRPSIKIVVPDMLKGLLVDDWENVTKNNQLVPLPHPAPVSKIIADYSTHEKPKRPEGSASMDILEETLAGLKEYFDKCLGRILLYRFERAQYAEIREKWTSGGPEWQGKTASDTYGAEHLMRLMVSLPELVAQTNMDQQSVNRLREELTKFCLWLEKNASDYFVNEYEVPNSEYAEKAKN